MSLGFMNVHLSHEPILPLEKDLVNLVQFGRQIAKSARTPKWSEG